MGNVRVLPVASSRLMLPLVPTLTTRPDPVPVESQPRLIDEFQFDLWVVATFGLEVLQRSFVWLGL